MCKVMRRIGDAIAALVVPIHHYGKNAAVGLRGASAWRANADFVLSVMADIDPQTGNVTNRQLAVAKDRDGAQGALTPFTLKPVELGLDDSGRPWGSMVAVAAEGTAKPASDWPQGLGVSGKPCRPLWPQMPTRPDRSPTVRRCASLSSTSCAMSLPKSLMWTATQRRGGRRPCESSSSASSLTPRTRSWWGCAQETTARP